MNNTSGTPMENMLYKRHTEVILPATISPPRNTALDWDNLPPIQLKRCKAVRIVESHNCWSCRIDLVTFDVHHAFNQVEIYAVGAWAYLPHTIVPYWSIFPEEPCSDIRLAREPAMNLFYFRCHLNIDSRTRFLECFIRQSAEYDMPEKTYLVGYADNIA